MALIKIISKGTKNVTNNNENQIQALEQAIKDLLGIIDCEESRAITIMAALHGHGASEETATRHQKIINNARKLIKRK